MCCSGELVAQDFNELTLKELEKQLNSVLKTRRDEEKSYISTIVKMVDTKKIPKKLVLTSFKYVRNKRPNSNHPFVYFVQVLRFQGVREKVAIPRFDFSIYKRTPRQSRARTSTNR